jgi:hypothetical protein
MTKPAGERAKTGKREGEVRIGQKRGHGTPPGDSSLSRKRSPTVVKTRLRGRQPERGGEGCRDAEELDRDVTSGGRTGIASQPLLPAETRMRALRPGKDDLHERWGSGGGRRQAHLQALVSHEVLAGAPMDSPTPIAPEQRGRTHRERMQQHADLARLRGFAALPLTLLAQWTRTTTADAGSIHDAQAPISFSALLVWGQLLGSRAPKRSIGLESKVLAREATGLPYRTHFWRGIARGRSGMWWRGWEGRSKLGRAHWVRMEVMPQFESQVPDPLGDQLPALLSRGRMAAPSVGIDLLVFIRERRRVMRHGANTTRPHRRR